MVTISDIEGKTLFPLSQLLDAESVPGDIVEFDQPLADLFEQIFFTDSALQPLENGCLGKTTLVLDQEVVVAPFGDAVQLVIGGGGGLSVFEVEVSLETEPGGFVFDLVLLDAPVLLRVPSTILRPLKPGSSEPDLEATSLDIALGAVTLRIGTYQPVDLEFVGSPAVPECMIGNTGVIISIGGIRWLTPGSDALPENTPLEFSGLYLEQVAIQLPEGLNDILPGDVTLEDFFIGSGGFCGQVTGNWDVDPDNPFDDESGDIFGFKFRLTSLGLEFKQNALLESSLAGFLKVPFFDEALEIEVGLTNDGDFSISFGSDTGLLVLVKPGVISIEVSSLEFIKEGDEFLFKLGGKITPDIAGLGWPSFELESLSLSSDGRVKVEGGWITLPELKTLDFHGFKIEISQLGFGTDEDSGAEYNWIGFSGGIQIVSGLPLRGGVEGLKVMWHKVTNEPKLKIGGVSLAFEIEKVLTFDGVAYFIDEADPERPDERIRGFKGGVAVGLIPLNGAGFEAQFIAGDNGQYKFFYIFIDVSIPVGVPVLPPALGLYGLAGLFAYNMTLDYPALVDYDNDAPRPQMTDVINWINEEGAMAFGAGVTVGTLADNGFTVKAKVILAIMIPGPVILIEGYTKILSFDETYPFRVLAVLDVPSGTFLMNISVEYAFPKSSGDLLDLGGSAEALIPAGDLGGWHLYLGQDKPESKRLQADVLGFFTAQTYFMIDQAGLALGVWIGYKLDEKYSILRVLLESWISGALAVSWMPLRALGTFTWFGRAELSAAGIGLGISIEATASVEVPRPITIAGSLTVQLKTPIAKPKATIRIKWQKEGTPPYPIPLAPTLGIEHRKVAENWDVLKSSEYGTDADGLWNEQTGLAISLPESDLPLVPPDVMLILNFDKSVVDAGLIAANNPDVPPLESAGAYEYKYELINVALEYSDTWSTLPQTLTWRPFEEAGSDYSLTAAWQAAPDPQGMKNTKLVINAISSLEISRVLADNSVWQQQLSLYNPDYPCPDPVKLTWQTVNFEAYDIGQVLFPMFEEAGWLFVALFPMRVYKYNAPWIRTTKSIKTEKELEQFRCLLILEVARTGQQNLLLTKGLEIRASTHPQAFVQYREEIAPYLDYVRRTELYINQSGKNPASGVSPAFIRFSQLLFPSWPDKVWITLMVDVTPDTLIIARDASGAEVDRIEEFSDCSLNPFTYLLQSSKGNPIRKIEFIGLNFQIKEICWNEYEYAETGRLWINLPEEMARLELHLSKGSSGTVYFLDEQNKELEAVAYNIPDDGTNKPAQPVALDVEHLAFKLILVEGSFQLLQVRGLPQASVDAVADYEERSTRIRTILEENWGKHSAQILLPNKYYRVRVDTASSRRKKGNSAWSTQNLTEYMYFKTGDPPGIYDRGLEPSGPALEPVSETEHYPTRGPLRDLSPYIDQTVPAGRPPNEPQPLHYRSYDVGLVFNDAYIEQMYLAAGFSLGIKLLDNNLQPVRAANGEEIFLNGWADNPTLSLTREETQYETLWDRDNCLGVSFAHPESNQELVASSPKLELLPQTQYKAQLWAGETHRIYEFTFMTSRYASFLHQIHDFQDAVWDHLALLANPAFEIDTAAMNATLRNANALEEWVRFEQLMVVFDLNPRPLPRRLEISLLNDKNQSYGLLLESPEPLPAGRVQGIALSIAGLSETLGEFDHALKLIRAGIQRLTVPRRGRNPDYNKQWLELLLLEKSDLSGYRIEYRDSAAGDDEPFSLYYTFAPGAVYPAGTRLTIYNGPKPDVATPPTEHLLLYAGHTAQSFIPGGTSIRLVSADGSVVHQRPFFQDFGYTAQDVHIIRNRDETRLFFFIKKNGSEYSELQPGIYRIAFTFLRDTGDGSPVLKRFGYTDPEEGQIEFSLPAFLPF